MNTNFIFAGVLGAVALAAVVFFVLAPSPAPVQSTVEVNDATMPPLEASGDLGNSFSSKLGPAAGSAPPISVLPTNEQEEAQQAELEEVREKMHDAMVTYSVEGIPVIEPLLSHPIPFASVVSHK